MKKPEASGQKSEVRSLRSELPLFASRHLAFLPLQSLLTSDLRLL